MSESSLYSLIIREDAAKRVKKQARARGLTINGLINELMTPARGVDG